MTTKHTDTTTSAPARRSWRRVINAILAYSAWVAATFIVSQLLVALLIAGVNRAGYDLESMGNTNLTVIGLGVVIYGLMLLMTIGIPRWVLRQATTLRELGIARTLEWRDIALALAGMVTYFVLTAVLLLLASEIVPGLDLEQAQEIGIIAPSRGLEIALAFMLLVVIGPFVEELLFRGYLYGKLRARAVPFWLTTLVVSVLFGLAHMQWNVGIDTFALSLVMCVTREITGSLWPSVLMHMMKNGIAFYFLFVNPQALQGLTG